MPTPEMHQVNRASTALYAERWEEGGVIMGKVEMIKDIDEAIEDDINYKSDFEDFEIIFKKLVLDFNHLLNDDEDDKISNNKMQVVRVDPQSESTHPLREKIENVNIS